MATVSSPSKALVQRRAGVFEPPPVKKSNESVGPTSPRHDRQGADHGSLLILRRLHCWKRGHTDEPTAMGRLVLGALAPIILKWPRSVQRAASPRQRSISMVPGVQWPWIMRRLVLASPRHRSALAFWPCLASAKATWLRRPDGSAFADDSLPQDPQMVPFAR